TADNRVEGNTVIMAPDARWALTVQGRSTGNVVLHNTLLNYNPAKGSINLSPSSVPGFVSNFNTVSDRFTTDDGDTVLSLAQWRAQTGQDGDSVVGSLPPLPAAPRHRPRG